MTGPTGSGKSTTFWLRWWITLTETIIKHILTIEDPIEFVHTNNKCLIQTNEKCTATLTASKLLPVRYVNPDVILVGELRDQRRSA
ncbi:ATPase, T2SS/T4P/T4SS family [Vibrio lentus]|nr:ATPase, T2SS/T4P/T4SS family [Vibrio lentus]